MTLVRQLDQDGDWTFGRGRQNYVASQSAIMQNIATRLRTFAGECFFDTQTGVDWLNLLAQKDQTALQLAVAATILNTDGVTRILQLLLSLDKSRQLSIKYQVQTVYSTSDFSDVQLNINSLLST